MIIAILIIVIALLIFVRGVRIRADEILLLNQTNLRKPEKEELPPGWALVELGDEFITLDVDTGTEQVHQVVCVHDEGTIETRVIPPLGHHDFSEVNGR